MANRTAVKVDDRTNQRSAFAVLERMASRSTELTEQYMPDAFIFALGGTPDSVTGAFLSASILLRAVQGTAEKSDVVFGFAR